MTVSNFFKIFILTLAFFVGFLNFQTEASEKDNDLYAYIFHLWYANGNLTIDNDFDFPFDLTAKKYQPISTPNDSYLGKIISIKGVMLATISFSPAALVSGNSGKLSLEAPYFPNAKTALFYDALGKELLTIDLAPGGPLCNENRVCNANFGEDSQNCPIDCLKENVEMEKNVPANNKAANLPLIISVLIVGFLAIALGAWIIIRKRNL